jgi:hypothetical protein
MSLLAFAWEPLDTLLEDGLERLATADFLEVEVDQAAVPLEVDWDHYRQIERVGTYRIISARLGLRLVGYNSFFINRHSRHRGQTFAMNDVLYLTPDQRRGGAGVRFLRESDRMLKEAGAIKCQYGIKEHVRLGASRGTVGDLLARMGYRHIETVYAKVL